MNRGGAVSLNEAPEIPQATAAEMPAAAQRTTNKMAVAGLVLSLAPLFGLIFSIVGLTRAKTVGGAGRRLAAAGIVLSLVFAGLYGFCAYSLGGSNSGSSAAASDAACVSAEASLTSIENTLAIDDQKLLSTLGQSMSAGNANAQYVYAEVVGDDLNSLKSAIDGDEAKATHANVKSAVSTVDDDIAMLAADLTDLSTGYFPSDLDKLKTAVFALDDLCGGSATMG